MASQNSSLDSTCDSLEIMLLGEPGIGKSTLVNGLLAQDIADVGERGVVATAGITRDLIGYKFKHNGVSVNVWDTPGLLDITFGDRNILSEVKTIKDNISLFLFCVNMSDTRFLPGNQVEKMIEAISKNLGRDIWKRTLIVLVRANCAISAFLDSHDTDDEAEHAYKTCFNSWEQLIRKELKDDFRRIVAAGHWKKHKLFKSYSTYWLSDFWQKSYETIELDSKKAALIKLNTERITKVKVNMQVGPKLEEQPIIVTESFYDTLTKLAMIYYAHLKEWLVQV